MGLQLDELGKCGQWTPLEFVESVGKHRILRCACDCGQIRDVRLTHLRSGRSTSCGCSRRKDLIGCRFGRLVVQESISCCPRRGQSVKCRCDCGNETVVRAEWISSGNTKSCGCLTSVANENISRWLREQGVKFQPEYRDDRCRHLLPLPFDFAVWIGNQLKLIEFQGFHHYHTKGNRTPERLADTQRNDAIKDQFCRTNNIPLMVIPYWQRADLELMLSEFCNPN